MPFDITTRTLLEYYTSHTPETEDNWYRPWITILTTVFPSAQGYVVAPQRNILQDSGTRFPNLFLEVIKLFAPPLLTFRTVLIVKVRNTQHWEGGIPSLQRQITRQTDIAFRGVAFEKVYWIGAIGPHWRYGIKEDNGQELHALIPWHHVTHDEASFDSLQALAGLVAQL